MRPSNHTLLMNYVIGMCKNNDRWLHPLFDLGYSPRLLEHTISLSATGGTVKPDVVAASNRLLNALAFDCKGGKNIEGNQAERYHTLSSADLLRWIDVPEPPRMTHDVCYVGLESNRLDRIPKLDEFPKLIFSASQVRMAGRFHRKEVEESFTRPIPLVDGMSPPMLYYPFSETDDQAVILPFVLRAIIETSTRLKRGGDVSIDSRAFETEEFMKRVHGLWDLMGDDTRANLRAKVRDIIRAVVSDYPDFMEKIGEVRERKNLPLTLSNLIPLCEKMLAEEEKKSRITDFEQN